MPKVARFASLAVPFALLLSGCSDPASESALQPHMPTMAENLTSVPWGLLECRYLIGFVPIAASALAPYLPEGFQPAPCAIRVR